MRSIVFAPLVPNLKFFVRAGRDLGPEGIKSLVPPPKPPRGGRRGGRSGAGGRLSRRVGCAPAKALALTLNRGPGMLISSQCPAFYCV